VGGVDSPAGFDAKLQNQSAGFESWVAHLAGSEIVTRQEYHGENLAPFLRFNEPGANPASGLPSCIHEMKTTPL